VAEAKPNCTARQLKLIERTTKTERWLGIHQVGIQVGGREILFVTRNPAKSRQTFDVQPREDADVAAKQPKESKQGTQNPLTSETHSTAQLQEPIQISDDHHVTNAI